MRQCCPLQPVWVRKVTVRQDFHKWVSDSNRISGNWRAACKQPREGASTTDPVGHATCNGNFDLCNCPALCAVAVCHLGSISSSLLELFVASSGYQQISKQPLWQLSATLRLCDSVTFPLIPPPPLAALLNYELDIGHSKRGSWWLFAFVSPLGVRLIADALLSLSPLHSTLALLIYALREPNRTRRVCNCNRRRVRFMGAQTRIAIAISRHCPSSLSSPMCLLHSLPPAPCPLPCPEK